MEKDKIIVFIVCVATAFIIMNSVNAETLEMDKNVCEYHPEVNKDYCKTEYFIYDDSLEIEKISLIYSYMTADAELKISDGEFYAELPGIDTEYKLTEMYENEYRVEVEGWKSPLLTIDNVLCYDGNCHYEFALWNGTYDFRHPVWGFIASLESPKTGMIPLNITFNESIEIFWCNFTVNTSNATIGYVYWNNYTDYICVDTDESSAVETYIDRGNGTNYGDIFADKYMAYMVNETSGTTVFDMTINNNHGTTSGASDSLSFNGKIANGFNLPATDDILTIGDNPTETHNSSIISIWFKPSCAIGPEQDCDPAANNGDRLLRFPTSGRGDIYMDYTTGRLITDSWCDDTELASTTSSWSIGTWYNVILTYDLEDDEADLWVNGEKQDDCNADVRLQSQQLKAGVIGGRPTTWGGVLGMYDLFMVWSNVSYEDDDIEFIYYSQLDYFPFGAMETNTTPPNGTGEENETTPTINLTLEYERSFCYNDDYLYKKEKTINESGDIVFNEYLILCDTGCDNETIINLGRPGCKETLYENLFIFLVVTISFALVLRKLK